MVSQWQNKHSDYELTEFPSIDQLKFHNNLCFGCPHFFIIIIISYFNYNLVIIIVAFNLTTFWCFYFR